MCVVLTAPVSPLFAPTAPTPPSGVIRVLLAAERSQTASIDRTEAGNEPHVSRDRPSALPVAIERSSSSVLHSSRSLNHLLPCPLLFHPLKAALLAGCVCWVSKCCAAAIATAGSTPPRLPLLVLLLLLLLFFFMIPSMIIRMINMIVIYQDNNI
jgi:hypothetical protein